MVDWSTIYDTVFVLIHRIHNGTDLPACLPANHHHVVVPLPSLLLLCHAIYTRDHPAATAARSIQHHLHHYHYHQEYLHDYYYYHGVGENDQ